MSNQAIFDYLKCNGCCVVCCLRYLKARGNEYMEIETSLEKLNVIGTQKNDEVIQETVNKKIRTNPCITCLGLFEEGFQNLLIDEIVQNPDIKQYDCPSVVIAISMPMILQIRQLAMWFALIKQFGENVDTEKAPDVPIKEAAKLILNPIICKKINKNYDVNGTMINIFLSHSEEAETLETLLKVDDIIFKNKSYKEKKLGITRGYLERNYVANKIPSKTFEEYVSVPPKIAGTSIILEKITTSGPTVFMAGRYRKLTRALSHSPWILQGKRVMEDSIQEIIIRSVAPYFGVTEESIVFSSSGREDIDVRCLGKGRPFVLEVQNSTRICLSQHDAAEIERNIEKSLKVSVRNIQMVCREDLVHIKSGEETKKKFYRALCAMHEPATSETLQKLNIPEVFQIQQITPIRVLHRRPLHTRPRNVYSVKAMIDPNNSKIVILDIVSQAGTYIKELVHGEFGRTSPSISSIIGQFIDIIALDVVGIDLDWPKEIDNSMH